MEFRTLGRSGPRVSVVGLGCANFGSRIGGEAARAVIDRALDCGITFFDTADSYGARGASEECLGAALGPRRNGIVLATKFGNTIKGIGPQDRRPGASARYIMSAVEASLQRLRTDWIDLYQLHYPDPATPIEETLKALDDLIRQGKVRFIGCSNSSAAQIDEAQQRAQEAGTSAFVSCQNQYSLLVRDIEDGTLAAIERNGLGLLPFAPLANGLLSGKYRHDEPLPPEGRLSRSPDRAARYLSPANWQILEGLRRFAETRGRSVLELAFSWLARQPAVSSIIAGAMTAQQVEQNATAANWVLTSGELADIDRLARAAAAARPSPPQATAKE
jgi:aryl-alcohol dehydrogenase-like predicted oxidoreductase